MAANSRLGRILQLQRIANASRKFGPSTPTTPIAAPSTPTVLKSLPEHKSLLPLLLSHDIPSKIAQACADRFDRYANQLRSETETKLAQYLTHRCKNPPARVYSFYVNSYSQALRDWAQSILNAALKSLKRNSAEIRNWDVTYPQPLWLPLPLDSRSGFTHKPSQTSSLSSTSAPPHAFPTTYPPPLRPPSGLSPIEWLRTPAAPSISPSRSTLNLDSLCTEFAKSLIIGGDPVQSSQPKVSIFLVPDTRKGGSNVASPRVKGPKSGTPQSPTSQKFIKPTSTSPRKAFKPRQLSAPPSFPQTALRVRPKSRKASSPATTSSIECTAPLPTLSDPLPNPPQICPLPTRLCSLAGGSEKGSYFGLTPPHPVSSQLPLDLGIESQNSPCSFSGPATPPSLSSNLFSEPAVASPSPILSEPFPAPIVGEFAQFQLQCDYFPHISLASSYDDAESSFKFPLGLFWKNAFDAGSVIGCPSFASEPLTSVPLRL